MTDHILCRLCDGACGLLAEVGPSGEPILRPDPGDPVSEGFLCDTAAASLAARAAPTRVTRPLRRGPDGFHPAGWDEAIADIGRRLGEARSRGGPDAVGVYLGAPVLRSTAAWARALAFGVGSGSRAIFSELSEGLGPRLRAADLMLGHPTPLLADLGRAHYVVLLGDGGRETDWGPVDLGMAHERWIQHSRKTKGTRVVAAGVRATARGAEIDQQVLLRPGTEPFFLLGMLSAAVHGNWHDRQYVADHTTGWDALVDLLSGWPIDRCAAACGVDPAVLSGVALKFSRAAMAVAHPGHSSFANAASGVGAWAWLALHAVTANALRPGGLYDHKAVFDLHFPLATVPSSSAPRSRTTNQPLFLLQAPAGALADEILTPGAGLLRALVCVSGDPARSLPATDRVEAALDDLDLLVCLAREVDPTAARAHWVLPIAHPFEEADVGLLEAALLPRSLGRWTPAVAEPPGEARPIETVLRDLFSAIHPGLRGSAWGLHLTALGQAVARADLTTWLRRLVDWSIDEGWQALAQPPHRIDKGDADRSAWRVQAPGERIALVPEAVRPLVESLVEPVLSGDERFWLRTSGRPRRRPDPWTAGPDPGLSLHPDCGIAEGATVRVTTRWGSVEATLRHDGSLRPDAADLPAGYGAAVGRLLPGGVDPLTGASTRDGVGCRVERVR